MKCSIERYPFAFEASQKLLNACQCSFYPVNIERIIEKYAQYNILLLSESLYQRFRNETHQTRACITVKDGRTYYDPKRNLYLIIYNSQRPKNRIRFTLAHEFAHIILGHLSDARTEIERGGLPDPIYFAYEGAANTFAGNLLVPPIILSEKLGSEEFVAKAVASIFEISEMAVNEYRKDDFLYWKTLTPMPEELNILKRYKDRSITVMCECCQSVFTFKEVKFCPICGSQSLSSYEGEENAMAKYNGVKIGEDGRTAPCPVCNNEEHVEGATFCMICGKPAVNQCTAAIFQYGGSDQCEHTEPLPGNARYCPYCGSEATFFKEGLLKDWNGSQVPAVVENQELCDDDGGDLPF